MNTEKEIYNIKLDDIIPNRFQPRLNFEAEGLAELSESIKQHGIIQPLVLRRVGNKYEIIAGERRYKSSIMASLNSVPAIIVDLNDGESAEVALVENIQRRELSPIEEARSYKNILDLGGLKQDELAKRMGKNQSTVSNKLRLLNLAEDVQNALLTGKISERHARSLLSLKNQDEQLKMLNRILIERLTVRQTDDEVLKMVNSSTDEDEEIIDIIEEDNSSNDNNDQPDVYVNPFFSINNLDNKNSDEPLSTEIPYIPTNPVVEQLENPFVQTKEFNNIEEPKEEVKPPVNKFFSSIPFIKEEKELEPQMENNIEENVKQVHNPMDVLPDYTNKEVYPQPVGVIKNIDEPIYNNYQTMVAPAHKEEEEFDPDNFTSIIKAFRNLIDKIEENEYYVDSDEVDYEDYYEFTIKIDKERL